jgi:SAM-dependent methyltransferase
VLSVFAVIFAGDPERAAAEIIRVLAPGGRAVLAAWRPTGTIASAGMLLQQALAELSPTPPGPPPPWGDPAQVRSLFGAHGAHVSCTDEALRFEADSPEAWFAEQQAHHPVWRFAERALSSRPGAWASLRERSIEALAEGNEDPDAFRVTSEYLVYEVRPGAAADRPRAP